MFKLKDKVFSEANYFVSSLCPYLLSTISFMPAGGEHNKVAVPVRARRFC